MIAAGLALISIGALLRVIARRRSCTPHRPRLLELVEKIESAPDPAPEWSRPVPIPDPPVSRADLRALGEHRTWNIPSGHAPSANDYARAVGMPTPGAGTKRRG